MAPTSETLVLRGPSGSRRTDRPGATPPLVRGATPTSSAQIWLGAGGLPTKPPALPPSWERALARRAGLMTNEPVLTWTPEAAECRPTVAHRPTMATRMSVVGTTRDPPERPLEKRSAGVKPPAGREAKSAEGSWWREVLVTVPIFLLLTFAFVVVNSVEVNAPTPSPLRPPPLSSPALQIHQAAEAEPAVAPTTAAAPPEKQPPQPTSVPPSFHPMLAVALVASVLYFRELWRAATLLIAFLRALAPCVRFLVKVVALVSWGIGMILGRVGQKLSSCCLRALGSFAGGTVVLINELTRSTVNDVSAMLSGFLLLAQLPLRAAAELRRRLSIARAKPAFPKQRSNEAAAIAPSRPCANIEGVEVQKENTNDRSAMDSSPC